MDDKATAAKIVADAMNSVCETSMEKAIVAALEAARRDAITHDHKESLRLFDAARKVNGIIDCTGEVPVVRRTTGTLVLTEDGVVVTNPFREVWTLHAKTHKPYKTTQYHAGYSRKVWSTEDAARAAMEGGKA